MKTTQEKRFKQWSFNHANNHVYYCTSLLSEINFLGFNNSSPFQFNWCGKREEIATIIHRFYILVWLRGINNEVNNNYNFPCDTFIDICILNRRVNLELNSSPPIISTDYYLGAFVCNKISHCPLPTCD